MSEFARIPARFSRRLRLGEITFDQHGVMVVLVELADYRTRTAMFATIEVLRHELGWTRKGQERSERHLRNCLDRLRSLKEIDFASRQGQRGDRGNGWEIRIVQADFFERQPPKSSEVTSDDGPHEGSVNREAELDNAALELRTVLPSSEVDRDQTRRDEDEDQSRAVSALIDQSLGPGSDAARLMALLPKSVIAANTRGVIERYLAELQPYNLGDIVDEFEAAQRSPEIVIRNEAKYLVGILRERAERKNRAAAQNGRFEHV